MNRGIRGWLRRLRALWAIAKLISDYNRLRKRSNRDVIVLTMLDPDVALVKKLRENLNGFGITSPLLVLREGTNLRTVPETDMRRFGWHRK